MLEPTNIKHAITMGRCMPMAQSCDVTYTYCPTMSLEWQGNSLFRRESSAITLRSDQHTFALTAPLLLTVSLQTGDVNA